ncbi:hypothetical protein A2U01_0073263, partial [Trifolium medium]|nr:hypothetical protein [Trifolium medium]
TGSNGLISYQSPTTDPQTLVVHNYDGPTIESSKVVNPACHDIDAFRPEQGVRCIPSLSPRRRGRPPT